jgi:hypothetical protein
MGFLHRCRCYRRGHKLFSQMVLSAHQFLKKLKFYILGMFFVDVLIELFRAAGIDFFTVGDKELMFLVLTFGPPAVSTSNFDFVSCFGGWTSFFLLNI